MKSEALRFSLSKHPFVQDFLPAHIEKLAELAQAARFERDQVIFREGEHLPEFYLIMSGLIALEIVAGGHVFRVQTLTAGDEFGWSALLMREGRYFQARALDVVEALAFDANRLLATFEDDPAFGFTFMQHLLGVVSQRLQATRLQLLDMYSPVAKAAGA